MKVLQIPVGQMANFTYIVADEESRDAVIIDPSWDLDDLLYALKKKVSATKNTIPIMPATYSASPAGNEMFLSCSFKTARAPKVITIMGT